MLENQQISADEDPSKIFVGVRYVLLGFDPDKKEQIQSKLFEGGGIDAVNYGPDCTHVIVDNLVYDDPVCVRALNDRKKLVTALWVDHSFDVGSQINATSILYRPVRDLNGIPGAQSMVVCLTGYQRQDRDDIMTMVSLMGAIFSKPLVANKVTHLICYKFEGEKYELAKKMKKIKLINHRWLEDCLEAWEILPETTYAKSTYELELEAEAKDSEEEAEEMDYVMDTRSKGVVIPQSTRVDNEIYHQSPVKQDELRTSSYLSASKSLGNIGDTSKIQTTPGKESHFEKASFSRDNSDMHQEMLGSSSTKNSGKLFSGEPLSNRGGTPVSNKIGNEIASVSGSAKKSKLADAPKLNTNNLLGSDSRKRSLSLSSQRVENNVGGPSASSASKLKPGSSLKMPLEKHEDITVLHGEKTPSRGIESNERQISLLPEKRKSPLSHASPKSLRVSHDFEALKEKESTMSPKKMLASESSVGQSSRFAGHTSPVKEIHHRNEEGSRNPTLLKDGEKSNEVAPKGSSRRLKMGMLSNVEVDHSSKKVSSEVRSSMLDDTVGLDKVQDVLASVSGSAKKPLRTISKLNSRSASRSTPRKHVLSLSSERMENDLSKTPELKDLTFPRNGDSSGEVVIPQSDVQSIEPPLLNLNISADERSHEEADLNSSKPEQTVSKKNPPKKVISKKTLGARPTLGKGKPAIKKGSINLQKAVLQNNSMTRSDEADVMEDISFPAVSEVAKVPQSTEADNHHELQELNDKDNNVDDETEGPDDKPENELLEPAVGKEKSCENKVSHSENVVAGKKSGSKIMGTKSKVVKSVEGNKAKKAKKAVPKKTTELTEFKSTLEAVEDIPVKGGKRSLNKTSNVNDETDDPDDKSENELLEPVFVKEKSGENEVSHLENADISDTGKKSGSKITGTKSKVVKSVEGNKAKKVKKAVSKKNTELTELKSTAEPVEEIPVKGRKRTLNKTENIKASNPGEEDKLDGSSTKEDKKKTKAKTRPSKKFKGPDDADKENEPVTIEQHVPNETKAVTTKASKPIKNPTKETVNVKDEPACFILSGHRLQRKEFQQVIKGLKGRVCRDSHHWAYQATHFIVPDPIRRTEKFFAAASSGSWILKMDYLTASNEAGKFLPEEPYEWHKKCLSEDGAINLESPRKWRLLREQTGHGAFYGMSVVIYGECIAPPLETLKRAIKAGEGTILATSPPYTRALKSRIDFAIVSPGTPRVDMWVQEFIRAEVPCVLADYIVEYVCKPGYPLDKHVQYNTHALAEKSLKNLIRRVEEIVEEPRTPEGYYSKDDLGCQVCESRDRGDEMLICGDASGNIGCGVGFHLDCLDPPLYDVPEEDWFCPTCSKSKERKKVGKRSSKSKK